VNTLDIDIVTSLRAELWDAGYRPVPVFNANAGVPSPGKQPLGKAWQVDARKDPPFCARSPAAPHALNAGILADGKRPVDIDINDHDLALRVRTVAIRMLGDTLVRTRDNSGRCLLLYRAACGSPPKCVLAGRLGKIEVLGHGQQFVALGVHPSGAELRWFPVPPQQMAVENLPAVTEEQITEFFRAVAPLIEAEPPGDKQKTNGQDHASADPQADSLRIAAALACIPNSGPPDWEWWNRVGMAVWRATSGSAAGWEAWNAWSARNAAHDPEATRARWDHYATSPPTSIGAGTIFHMATGAEQRAKPNGADARPEPPDEGEDRTSAQPSNDASAFFDPWADPPPHEFPGGVLTREMEDTIFALALRDGVCPGALAMAYLAAASGAAPKAARFLPYQNGDWSVPPIVWVMTIADSGQRKTAIEDRAFVALREQHARNLHGSR
jgi:hypothetical protein